MPCCAGQAPPVSSKHSTDPRCTFIPHRHGRLKARDSGAWGCLIPATGNLTWSRGINCLIRTGAKRDTGKYGGATGDILVLPNLSPHSLLASHLHTRDAWGAVFTINARESLQRRRRNSHHEKVAGGVGRAG